MDAMSGSPCDPFDRKYKGQKEYARTYKNGEMRKVTWKNEKEAFVFDKRGKAGYSKRHKVQPEGLPMISAAVVVYAQQ